LISFLIGLFWLNEGFLFAALFPFVCLPLVVSNLQAVWVNPPSGLYNAFVARSALCELIFSVLLSMGIILG
jgi:hypothetical protein